MRFWDASAIVPLIVQEAMSPLVRGWLADDPDVAVWSLTRVELASAIERRSREGSLGRDGRRRALATVSRFTENAHEVLDLTSVRARATLALARHSLRAADALQLGAALVLADPDPTAWSFVVLDARLADAAEREGFQVLTQ